jgi:hypothetical protein
MAHAEITRPRRKDTNETPCGQSALAAGLFGYSICDGQMRSFKPTEGYLRDMEQMPSFAPPSVSNFVAQYLASNIGKTKSSS